MTCYKPLEGYQSREKTKNGKRSFTTSVHLGYRDRPMTVPCGQCIGCRLQRSRDWATRCVHEASLYTHNCFITLTYKNEHNKPSLEKRDFQLFMKRLRKKYPKTKIRFYHCGEYGKVCKECGLSEIMCKRKGCGNFTPTLGRAHHHACIFNFDFPDREFYNQKKGVNIYTSKILQQLWPYGFSTVGDVTFESSAYVARYVTKKITGEMADDHYQKINLQTGEVTKVLPEYTTMSRKPGIAKAWFELFTKDVYPKDYLTIRNNIKIKPPKYYDYLFDMVDEKMLALLKKKRRIQAEKRKEDNTDKRLRTRLGIQERKAKLLVRSTENI